ncbi:hypothetical protein X975_23561, partial [Stegodyphus mimosarum]
MYMLICVQSNAVRHKNDCIRIEAWVNKMISEDNCILFYKPRNRIIENYPKFKNDFTLIKMNDSQRHLVQKFRSDYICINIHKGRTVMDLNKSHCLYLMLCIRAFPVHFLLQTELTCKFCVFFAHLKDKVGQLTSKILMI